MTQEDKELLLKDLCARLPYGVKIKLGDYDYQVCSYNPEKSMPVRAFFYRDSNNEIKSYIDIPLEDYCPYFRPISSMTEEEYEEFCLILDKFLDNEDPYFVGEQMQVDFYHEHHFDNRKLIEKGLAIEAPEGMYK